MNTAGALLEYPLLAEDEIKTLGTFSTLIRGGCLNDHEENYPSTAIGIKTRIRQCSHRVSNLVISCPHAQVALLGEEGARDVLDRVILIFQKTSKQIYEQAIGYRNILRLFDFLRQAIEGDPYRLITTSLGLDMFLGYRELVAGIYTLSTELCNNTITPENKPHFLLRFQTLKNEFFTTLEPFVFDSLQQQSKIIEKAHKQPVASSPLSFVE